MAIPFLDDALDFFDFDFGLGDVTGTFGDFGSFFTGASNLLHSVADLAAPYISIYSLDQAAQAALDAGLQRAEAFESGAQLYESDAEQVEKLTFDEAAKLRRHGLRILSQQRMDFLKSGVTMEGSPLIVLEETSDLIEADVERIFERGNANATRLRKMAEIERQKADAAVDSAEFEAEKMYTSGIMKELGF